MAEITAKYTLIFGIPQEDFYAKLIKENVLFCEMRPSLLGAKILSEKLRKNGIKSTLISDSGLGHLFFLNRIKRVYLFSLNNNSFSPGAQAVKILADWHGVPIEVSEGSNHIKNKQLVDKNAQTFLGKKTTVRKIRVINPQNETLD